MIAGVSVLETAGRIENAQVAVCPGYAAPAGRALIDRELYLPKSWTSDPVRCAAAWIPEGTAFAAKPQLAQRMIERAAAAGVPFARVAGDEVCGGNGPLRGWPGEQGISCVLVVDCRRCSATISAGGSSTTAELIIASLARRYWYGQALEAPWVRTAYPKQTHLLPPR